MDGTREFTPHHIRELDEGRKEFRIARVGAGYAIPEVDAFLDESINALRALLEENEALRAGVSSDHVWGAARTKMTPFDVQAKEFRIARLGRAYRMRDVDEYIDDVTHMLSQLLAENEALRAAGSAS